MISGRHARCGRRHQQFLDLAGIQFGIDRLNQGDGGADLRRGVTRAVLFYRLSVLIDPDHHLDTGCGQRDFTVTGGKTGKFGARTIIVDGGDGDDIRHGNPGGAVIYAVQRSCCFVGIAGVARTGNEDDMRLFLLHLRKEFSVRPGNGRIDVAWRLEIERAVDHGRTTVHHLFQIDKCLVGIGDTVAVRDLSEIVFICCRG